MNPDIFIELSIILFITVIISIMLKMLKQPMIIAYILSGIFAGPTLFNVINSTNTLAAFSQIGVALLLFFVGINLNPKVIKEVGLIAFITGIGQVIFTTGVGYLILRLFGYSQTTSLYLGIGLAFSSTIVIMKLLSDKKDLDKLYGKISIGFLIVQDFIAIGILLFISSLSSGKGHVDLLTNSTLIAVGAIAILIGFTKYILPHIINFMARSQELLLLFSISWCFLIGTLFHFLGFSIEIGALLSGMTLSISKYHYEISSKLKPIRDFFLILFFIVLGSQMVFSNVIQNLHIIVGLSLFVLVGNPIILMTLMGLFGYTKRNSFLAGLTVAQISEFSLIVISMGITLGHIDNKILSIATGVGLLTFAGSSYMILYSNKLYNFLSPYLDIFERKGKKVDEKRFTKKKSYEIILFGYNRIGFDILESLKHKKKNVLIVDYNPEVIDQLSKNKFNCIYGDAEDIELLNELKLSKAKMIISTIPGIETNITLVKTIRKENEKAIIAVLSEQVEDTIELYNEGANYVLMPHILGGKHFSNMIVTHELDHEKYLQEKLNHMDYIHRRHKKHHH